MGRKTHGPYLVAAIEYNDINKVSEILSTKFRDRQKVKHFLTSEVRRLASEYTEVPLLLSATLDDPTILKYFVTKHETNINYVHEYGFQKPKKRKTALLVAVRRGLYAMVDTILALNGDVNVQDHKGRTALHHAVRRADYRMAKLLLSRGAQVGINDASGNSPLHIATIFGHMELVRLLLRQGGDLYRKGQHGAIPIHIAAKEGHASLVRMFCEQYEVNVNIMVPCYDEREKAPLHVAAMEGHAETVFALLEYCRADVNLRDSEGETPLHCVAIHEYDPLGMKSKEDFTETVKVLLNYGAETNKRNARGETALHLAARNEFQKIVEVLVLAGSDPLIEDDDRNKAIDLVAPEDTVSKQTLKNAMADREKYLAEALEVRARGFTTSLQNRLPFTSRSQSTMNMPLAGLHGVHGQGRFNPSHGSSFGSNYHLPIGGSSRQIYGGQFHQSSHSHSSSSGSKRRSKDSIQSVPKLPPSMSNQYDVHPPVPLSAIRKVRSVEELDQQLNKAGSVSSHVRRSKQSKQGRRKNSYQESETTSFWSVTPPGSLREGESDLESKRSIGKKKKAKSVPKLTHERRLNESDEELNDRPKKTKTRKPEAPLMFLPPKDMDDVRSFGGDESDYFLDDDDSVDMLEVERLTKGKKQLEKKILKAMKTREPEVKPGLSSWLDEQSRFLKTKEKPVAHSTPPLQRNVRPTHDDDDDDDSMTSSDSESDEEATTVITKPKPLPPPKPVKDSVARIGVPVLPLAGSKASLNPRNQKIPKDNPDIERVIQLEVNESFTPGETVIRVIPVNPSGPEKVHTVSQGTGSTTFLRLQGDAPGSISSEQVELNDSHSRKNDHRKPAALPETRYKNSTTNAGGPATGGSRHNKSKDSVDAALGGSEKKPIPKPREGKTSTSSAAGALSSAKTGKKGKPQLGNVSESDSFSASSDELPIVSPSTPKMNYPKKADIKTPQGQSQGHSQGQSSSHAVAVKEKSSSRKPLGLVFQKACAESEDTQKADASLSSLENGDRKKKTSEQNRSKDSSTTSKTTPSRGGQERSRHAPSKSTQKKQPESSGSEETESITTDESEDEEEDAEDEATASQDLRTIRLTSDGNLSYTLVGGNIDGVFVHALDRGSEAAKKDLRCGDQILKANDQVLLGRTREEAMQILRSVTGPLNLIVRRMPAKYRAAVKNEGMTDSMFVRAHFNHDPGKRGELVVREGDVFCVSDTFPESNVGFWKAQKMNPKEDEEPSGFIPNRSKADQITTKQKLAQGKVAPDQRGGTFLRSFRRAKSADRNSRGQDEDEKAPASPGVLSYEKVSQKISSNRRPVIVLGLFCDVVINMIAKDSPDQFETLTEGVENTKDTESPVNIRLLQGSMNHGKHCLVILSPPSIEYLQQKTDLNPITIYMSPVSKATVKALKAKLAPFYNKHAGYMYEEAVRFEKNYAHLFSASVPYTTDDWWFFHLKEAISRVQNQPIWQTLNSEDLEARIALEMNRILPEPIARHPRGDPRPSRDRTARMSRTTDDLPQSPVTKVESNPTREVKSGTNAGQKKIEKQQMEKPVSSGDVASDVGLPTTFHRLHSHNFNDSKSGIKKRAQQQQVQSHETPL